MKATINCATCQWHSIFEPVALSTSGARTRVTRLLLVAVLVATMPACTPLGADKMTFTAMFADSAGLFVGNDVGILGVTVGEITEIEPVGASVRVTLEVDADRDVPAAAGAVVVARSVATDRYVELTPVYAGGPTLEDGDEIDLERTRTPVDFDQVLEAINTFATDIAGSKETARAVQRFIDEGSTALDGKGRLFNDTVKSLSGAVNSVSGQREEVARTLISLDLLVNTIAENQQTTRTFIQQVSRASRQLADQRVTFRTALRSIDRAVTVVADFAVKNRAEVVEALGGTTAVMRTVLERKRALIEILEVMPLALQNLARAKDNGRIPVRIDPSVLLPLGSQLRELCDQLPGPLCDLLGGTDPTPTPRPRGEAP